MDGLASPLKMPAWRGKTWDFRRCDLHSDNNPVPDLSMCLFVHPTCTSAHVLSYRIPANKPGIDIPPNKNTKSIPNCLPLAPEVFEGIGAMDVRVGDDGLATTDNEPLTGEEVVVTAAGVAVAATWWPSMEQSASNQARILRLPSRTHLSGPSTRSNC